MGAEEGGYGGGVGPCYPHSLERRAAGCPRRAASSLALPAEEGTQENRRALLVDAAIDLRPVIAARLIKDPRPVLDAAAFRIVRAEIDAAQAGKGGSPGAQPAGLQRHIRITVTKAPRPALRAPPA